MNAFFLNGIIRVFCSDTLLLVAPHCTICIINVKSFLAVPVAASFCELWLVGRHNAFNPAKHTFTSIHGIRFDLVQALGQEFAETVAMVIRRLQKLKLTEEETFLLMLLVVFSGGE